MQTIMMKSHSYELRIIINFHIKSDNYARFENLSLLFVVIYRKTFFLVKVLLNKISYIFVANAYINI